MNADRVNFLDRHRLEELYVSMEKSVYNVIYRWVWNRDEAQDLVQEAFMRLWRMKNRVRPETVAPLLYRIAVNLAANRRRAKKVRQWVGLESIKETLTANRNNGGQFAIRERELALRQAVEALPERLRRVILLSEFSGLTYEEIGQSLGIPSGTVGSRRNAAMKVLREKLGSVGEDNRER